MIVAGRPPLAGRSPDNLAFGELEPEARAAGQLLRLVRCVSTSPVLGPGTKGDEA
jgi:hypothetical protein